MSDQTGEKEMDGARNSKIVDVLAPKPPDGAAETNHGFSKDALIVLSGYLQRVGDSGSKRWRLYNTLDLSSRVEFDDSDVKYFFQDNEDDENKFPLRPVVVWLGSAARVDHVRRLRDEERIVRHEEFLVGDIADTYMAQAALGGLAAMQQRGGLLLSTLVAPCSFSGCGSPAPSCAE